MNLKKSLKKSVAAFITMSIISSNCYLCGLGLSKVIAEELKAPDLAISLDNSKYVQYSNEEYAGVAMQTSLKFNTVYEQEGYLPTKSVEVLLNLPALNGYYPERANVVTSNTYLTTGEKNNSDINQSYDINSGLLKLSYENKNNYSKFVKGINDEFEIIYIYPAQAHVGNEEQINLNYKADVTMKFTNNNETVTTQKTENIKLQEKENKGNLLNFSVTELKDRIYKGYMYSNITNGTSYNTDYKTVSTLCVLNSEVNNELVLNVEQDKFITDNEEKKEISTNNLVQYIATGISKTEFDKILGKDGYIEIYMAEEVIATVKYLEIEKDKKFAVTYLDGTVDELKDGENSLIVKYPENLTNMKIKVSKPVAEGFINFENQKTIKASKDYGYKLDKIEAIKETTSVNEYKYNTNLLLLEPETKISVISSNTNFSTLQKNKTTLTIKLDDTNASTKLFDNPTITIKLPEGLTSGKLSSPEILNGNGLTIKNASAEKNLITIELEGKQKEYDINNVSGGASIVMDIENMDFEDTLATHTDKIEVSCKQAKETIKASTDVNIVSKAGLLLLSNITGFKENTILTTIDSGVKTVEIENGVSKKDVVQTLNLVNNYEEDIKNLCVIGKLGYSNEENLSTFEMKLEKPIQTTGKVYYSTNSNASRTDDSWQEEFTTDAKAYKVEFNNQILESKANTEIKVQFTLPANIEYNQKAYIKTDVSYTYNEKNLSDSSLICMVTPTNSLLANNNIVNNRLTSLKGNSVPISLSISPNVTESYVHSGQVVIYKVKVTNNGTEALNDLTITDIIPENTIYTYDQVKFDGGMTEYEERTQDDTITQKEWTIKTLQAGETQEFEIMLTMKDVQEETNISNTVELVFNEQKITSTSNINLKPSVLSTNLTTSSEGIIGITFDAGNELKYYITVTNKTEKELKNVKVQYELPENLEYVIGGLSIYDEFEGYQLKEQGTFNNNIFEYNINKIKAYSSKTIAITVKVKQLNGKYEEDITSIAKLYVDNDVYETNTNTITTEQSAFDINLKVDTSNKDVLSKGDIVTYTITAKNIGERTSSVNIKDTIPEQLEVLELEKNVNEENKYSSTTSVQNVEIIDSLDKNDILTVKIKAKVKEIEVEENTLIEAINKAVLVSGDIELNSNEVVVNIKPELKVVEDNNVEEPENPTEDNENTEIEEQPGNDNEQQPNEENKNEEITNTEETYTISGVAWVDANKNGQKDADEKLQDSVIVSLVDMTKGNFALDTNGNRITTVTNSEGKYIFTNIPKGKYIVLFEFDTNTYTVTTYQKQGIEEGLNSDAILSNVTIDGNKKVAALTDKIELNSNKENIDIGLMENAIFDLSLNKQITQISVITPKGTENYEYENAETAKVDLVAKYMNNTNVVINYKFTIKNEGDVTGYVDSLVDNLPTGLEFSSDLNTSWYKGNDGKLYTTSLSGKSIAPGETAEIELVLTKTMTEENAGIFPNSAKLEKISNLQNIEEKQDALENNESSANLFISIKTGSAMMYISITTLCLGIVAIGIYFIKKKVLNRGI